MCGATRDVCFGPKADMWSALDQKQTFHFYSISSSASERRLLERCRPSALAVFILIANSNLVGCMIGNSPGLVPPRTLPTYTPIWRYRLLARLPEVASFTASRLRGVNFMLTLNGRDLRCPGRQHRRRYWLFVFVDDGSENLPSLRVQVINVAPQPTRPSPRRNSPQGIAGCQAKHHRGGNFIGVVKHFL